MLDRQWYSVVRNKNKPERKLASHGNPKDFDARRRGQGNEG